MLRLDVLGVVYTFNPSTRPAEAGGRLSSRPAWCPCEYWDREVYTERPGLNKTKETKRTSWRYKSLMVGSESSDLCVLGVFRQELL